MDRTDRIIRFGIIGAGFISRRFARALLSIKDEGVVLKAVASSYIEKAKAFVNELGNEENSGAVTADTVVYGSYEELAKDPDIDAVYIGLVNSGHAGAAMLCIENGKDVLCEKPFFINDAEARACIDAAKNKNVLIMEAMWTRTLPAYRKALQWINDGRIGEPLYVRADFSFRFPDRLRSPEGRMWNPAIGGGIFWDCGVYPYEYVTGLFGKPDEVRALCDVGSTGVDESAVFIMKYKSGLLADCFVSANASAGDTAVIAGSRGRIIQPRFYGCTRTELQDNEGNVLEVFEDPEKEGFVHDIRHFVSLMRQGLKESPYIPLAANLDYTITACRILKEAGYKEV